jgi:RNA polymerase sigma factor (sigma-70 family)
MTRRPLNVLLGQFRKLGGKDQGTGVPDRELLHRFVHRGDEGAFEQLLARHGPMVLNVCRRMLGDQQLAEDAFQATFLVLVRKAASIRQRELLGNWLYGTAYRTAAKARVQAAARRQREGRAPVRGPVDPLAEITVRELFAVLDEELQRLPAHLRAPLVLCYLEGKTRDEAAQQLGWSLATLGRRLESGRQRLGRRLTGRGVALSLAWLAAALDQPAPAAPLRPALVAATIQMAGWFTAGKVPPNAAVPGNIAALVDGVLKAMLLSKLQNTLGVCLVVLVALGLSVFAWCAPGAGQDEGNPATPGKFLAQAAQPPMPVKANPQKALTTVVYDIHDLMAKPVLGAPFAKQPDGAQASKAARLVQALVDELGPFAGQPGTDEKESVQILNGNRLVIHTTAARHAQITELLKTLRRWTDVAATAQARLYEVDAAFYNKLQSVKRVPLEELEKQFLEGNPPKDDLFKPLNRQKLILTGETIPLENGSQAVLLSLHDIISSLPSPQQARAGVKDRQTFQQGAAFLGTIQISADRRFIQLKLTEKATEVQDVLKVKVLDVKDQEVAAEVALLKETSQTQVLDIPDGGAILVPVQYRPPAARAKDRWWVLWITCRIVIEEEDRQIRQATLDAIVPELLADVVKNPQLKTLREYYGTPADKRLAVVNSATWTVPEKWQPDLAGYQWVAPQSKGNRLLGVRVEKFEESPTPQESNTSVITVTLVNAGGSDNGAAIGSSTIRYTARWSEKRWVVQLESR